MQLQMSCIKIGYRYLVGMDARTPELTQETLPRTPLGNVSAAAGWRADAAAGVQRSLPEANATISVPFGGHWARRLLAFVGPGYLVSVGYMDPGKPGHTPKVRILDAVANELH